MQIFVNSVESLNSQVYSVPPCVYLFQFFVFISVELFTRFDVHVTCIVAGI